LQELIGVVDSSRPVELEVAGLARVASVNPPHGEDRPRYPATRG
jgi:hypothetical protein